MKATCVVWLVLTCSLPASAQECVRLKAFSDLGIPVHPSSGNPGVSERLAHGTIAEKLETDATNGWIKIRVNAVTGWIIKKYIDADVPCPNSPVVADVAESGELTYLVGCWNLEHFHDGKTRGFPENTRGGPSYPTRTQSDYEAIAAVIEQIGLKVIAMSEIHAEEVEIIGEDEIFTDIRSPELERLIEILGRDNYDYVVGESGGSQHVAIFYDKRNVKLNASWEMELPNIKIQGKSIADRQSLVAHFTMLDGQAKKNDFAIVGVHLASGQDKNENHDEAMRIIRQELSAAREEGWCIPQNENDIVITGDFNTNRFDSHQEVFWTEMEANGWDVLADDQNAYQPTRLSGHPLELRSSRIDYIITTKGDRGLQGEEVTDQIATVHVELIAGGAENFRRQCSDHLPVSLKVKVGTDSDGE